MIKLQAYEEGSKIIVVGEDKRHFIIFNAIDIEQFYEDVISDDDYAKANCEQGVTITFEMPLYRWKNYCQTFIPKYV